jgi:diguanylate cyclase (GGDEF)-like protein
MHASNGGPPRGRGAGGPTEDGMPPMDPETLATRCAQQAREIRALEKIETLLERRAALEAANRALQVQLAELRTVWALSRTLAATLNPEELLPLALHWLGRALPADAYALFLLDEVSRQLTVKGTAGLGAARLQDRTCGLGEGIAGVVAATGEPQLTAADEATPGAGLYVPLKVTGGRVLGVLQAHRATPPPFSARDLAQGQAVATQVAVALENAQRYQRTKELSAKDELTGLANRRAFFEALEAEDQRARRYRRGFTILMLDLDAFKHYNDTQGHLRGDQALRAVGRLLLGSTRRADVVARFGGEEFVVLLPESLKAAGAVVAEKIRAAVAQHPLPGREAQPGGRLTITCGVAAYPGDAASGLEVVDAADRALYRGKQQGGNRVVVAAEGE